MHVSIYGTSIASCHSINLTYGRYANITLHHTCQIENTTYLETTAAGEPYTTIVIRDNCRTPGLYCNAANSKCEPIKPLQSKCQTDRECETVRTLYRVQLAVLIRTFLV